MLMMLLACSLVGGVLAGSGGRGGEEAAWWREGAAASTEVWSTGGLWRTGRMGLGMGVLSLLPGRRVAPHLDFQVELVQSAEPQQVGATRRHGGLCWGSESWGGDATGRSVVNRTALGLCRCRKAAPIQAEPLTKAEPHQGGAACLQWCHSSSCCCEATGGSTGAVEASRLKRPFRRRSCHAAHSAGVGLRARGRGSPGCRTTHSVGVGLGSDLTQRAGWHPAHTGARDVGQKDAGWGRGWMVLMAVWTVMLAGMLGGGSTAGKEGWRCIDLGMDLGSCMG